LKAEGARIETSDDRQESEGIQETPIQDPQRLPNQALTPPFDLEAPRLVSMTLLQQQISQSHSTSASTIRNTRGFSYISMSNGFMSYTENLCSDKITMIGQKLLAIDIAYYAIIAN
jgi:hypothetical protein